MITVDRLRLPCKPLRNACIVGIVALVLCGDGAARAQQLEATATVSRVDGYYQQLVAKIEPNGVGRPERLPLYLQLFEREMINDTRLFPFHVDAQWTNEQQVELTGYVGYEENRRAILRFLHHLGFDRVANRIELLPSKELGKRQFGFVRVPHALSYDKPTERREVVTDCLLGTPLFLLKLSQQGFILCHSGEGYLGFVRERDIHRVSQEEFSRYMAGAKVRLRHDVESERAGFIPMGARLQLVGRRDAKIVARLPTGLEVSLPAGQCDVDDDNPNPKLENVIDNASKMIGTRYLWGGTTSRGIDCSGLMQTSFAAEGVRLPRDSNQQAYLGALTATRWYREGMRRGDTLYFLGDKGRITHTAIYLGDGRYLEAVRPVVRYSSFNSTDKDYNERRAAAFCFAKRLLD